jgi:Right handed beta helix region
MCASYSNASNVTIDGKTFSKEGLTLSNCKNCTVSNCDFTYNSSTKTMCYLSNCQGCKVINSKYHNKSTIGVALRITGEKTKDNLVEGCEFTILHIQMAMEASQSELVTQTIVAVVF